MSRSVKSPDPMTRLIDALSRLPGIGEKSATRLSLFLLRDAKGLIAELIDSLSSVRQRVRLCSLCQNMTEEDPCPLCRDPERDFSLLCVVQEPVDLLMVEKTGDYRGLYHILHGALSPLDGIGPEEIRLKILMERVKEGRIREVILATNPNPEGEATALYIKKLLAQLPIKVTRIASGIPVGGTLEYSDPQTLSRALGYRRDY